MVSRPQAVSQQIGEDGCLATKHGGPLDVAAGGDLLGGTEPLVDLGRGRCVHRPGQCQVTQRTPAAADHGGGPSACFAESAEVGVVGVHLASSIKRTTPSSSVKVVRISTS
jgi:hypothetical protein